MGKAGISGQVQLDSLEEMGDVQDARAAPLDHFEFIIEAFYKPTRVPVNKVIRDVVEVAR